MVTERASTEGLLYGQTTRGWLYVTFAAWTLVGVGVALVMLPDWHVVSRIVFGAVLGAFSAMFPYTNRVLAMEG
jgi:hypothetical protein